jgi:PAS domain-containing protein
MYYNLGGFYKMEKLENISKNFIYIQLIYILAIIAIFGISYRYFHITTQNFESFRAKQAKYTIQISKIISMINDYKTVSLISSLRQGSDKNEIDIVNNRVSKIKDNIKILNSFAKELNDTKLKNISKGITKEFDNFYKLAKSMPQDFGISYEEGIDTLSAIEYINTKMTDHIKKYQTLIVENIKQKTTNLQRDINEAKTYMLIVLLIAIIVSIYIYIKGLKIQKISMMFNTLMSEKTKDLDNNLAILSHYNRAIEGSLLVIKANKDKIITSINTLMLQKLKYNENELLNTNLQKILFFEDDGRFDNHTFNGTMEFLSKDEELLIFQTTINPILDNSGDIIEYLIMMQDITDIEKERLIDLETTIQQAINIRYDQMLESLPIPSIVIDKEKNIISYNTQFLDIFSGDLVAQIKKGCNISNTLITKVDIDKFDNKYIALNTPKNKSTFSLKMKSLAQSKDDKIIFFC